MNPGNHDSYPADSYNQDTDQYNLYYDQGGFKDHVGKILINIIFLMIKEGSRIM